MTQASEIFILSYLSRRLEVIGSRDGSSDSVKHKEADCFLCFYTPIIEHCISFPLLATLGCKRRVIVV